MTKLVLTFNAPAVELLGSNTRLRVKTMKRGGQEYVALRPSYRVSGKNAMLRVEKAEDGTVTADLPDELITELGLPELKSAHTAHLLEDVGYGWFLVKPSDEVTDATSLVTIHKTRKGAAKKADAEATDAAPAATTDAAPSDEAQA